MRSLALWKVSHLSLTEAEFSSSNEAFSSLTAVAVDLDQNALLATTESKHHLHDGEARVEVWSLPETGGPEQSVSPNMDCDLL